MSVVVTLVVGFAVSTTQWIRADRHAAQEALLREKESALREQMSRDLYTSDMLAVQQAWEVGNVKRMGDLLRRHIPGRARPERLARLRVVRLLAPLSASPDRSERSR